MTRYTLIGDACPRAERSGLHLQRVQKLEDHENTTYTSLAYRPVHAVFVYRPLARLCRLRSKALGAHSDNCAPHRL